MSQDKLIKIKCKKTGEIRYSRKNKKQNPDKLTLRKYSKKTQKHEDWVETKK